MLPHPRAGPATINNLTTIPDRLLIPLRPPCQDRTDMLTTPALGMPNKAGSPQSRAPSRVRASGSTPPANCTMTVASTRPGVSS